LVLRLGGGKLGLGRLLLMVESNRAGQGLGNADAQAPETVAGLE
jgi:hypothetical protein